MTFSNRFIQIYTTLFLTLLILSPGVVFGQGLKEAAGNLGQVADKSGYNASDKDLDSVLGRVVKAALTLVGLIFLILMVYAGYLWMTARGEEGQVETAQKIIYAAIIGLVIVVSAYAITTLITARLQGAG